jgi:tetratricopeptide (TPR) repeat protein
MKDPQFSWFRITSLVLCLLLAGGAVAAYPPQNERRVISGAAYYADTGQPAGHIFVDVLTQGGSVVGTATTTDNGSFEFVGLSADVFQLAVHSNDYEPITASVDLSFSSSYGNELVLHKRAAVMAKPAGNAVSAHLLSLPDKAQQAYAAGNDLLFLKHKPADAILEFTKAVKAAPGFYEAYEALGWACQESGKSADAEDAFRKSIKVSGDKYAPADVGLGALLLDTQRLSEGEKTLQQAVALDAKSWRAFYELGRAMLMQNKVAEALKNAEQAKQLEPRAPSIYRLLANIHIRLHDSSALLDDLDAYIKLDPSSPAGLHAKEMRDQVAKMVPTPAPPPANHFSTGGAAMPVSQRTPAKPD